MSHQPASSGTPFLISGNAKSGSNKVIKDFILGGTSGAIAKTLAAPIERVKLLLQTQENNPKLAERPYKGTFFFIKVSSIASWDVQESKDCSLFGEVTGLMWWDTSPPKPSIFQQRTFSIRSFSKALIPKKTELATWPCPSYLVVLLDLSVLFSFILWILQELVWEQILESQKLRGNSMVSSIVVLKSSKKMEFQDFTMDFQSQSQVSSPIEPFTLEAMMLEKALSGDQNKNKRNHQFLQDSSLLSSLLRPQKPWPIPWIQSEDV